jgi:hypothetical protein
MHIRYFVYRHPPLQLIQLTNPGAAISELFASTRNNSKTAAKPCLTHPTIMANLDRVGYKCQNPMAHPLFLAAKIDRDGMLILT